jgi:hypothetical protein
MKEEAKKEIAEKLRKIIEVAGNSLIELSRPEFNQIALSNLIEELDDLSEECFSTILRDCGTLMNSNNLIGK